MGIYPAYTSAAQGLSASAECAQRDEKSHYIGLVHFNGSLYIVNLRAEFLINFHYIQLKSEREPDGVRNSLCCNVLQQEAANGFLGGIV
jgi:hypothetical protein